MFIITFLGCFLKLYLFVYGVYVCLHTRVQTCDYTCMSWHLCRGQRTTCGVVSLHPHRVPGIVLGSSGLMVSTFTFAAKSLRNPLFPCMHTFFFCFWIQGICACWAHALPLSYTPHFWVVCFVLVWHFAVCGVELRASWMLVKCSTTELYHQPCFVFVFYLLFWDGTH